MTPRMKSIFVMAGLTRHPCAECAVNIAQGLRLISSLALGAAMTVDFRRGLLV